MNEQHEQHDDTDFRICRYLDGEMTAEQAQAFEAELAADADLRTTCDAYRRLDAHLEALGGAVDVDYDAQRQRIRNQLTARRPRRMQWILKPALAVCAAAAMFVMALGAYQLLQGPAGPEDNPLAGGQDATATMALLAPAPSAGKVETRLRRQGVEEYLRHRMTALGHGSVVVSVGSPGGQAAAASVPEGTMGFWLN